MNWNSYLTLLTKINSKWIKDINIRPETIELLDENTGKISLTSVLAMIFLNMTPKPEEIKTKINQWVLGTKKRLKSKRNFNKMKRQSMEGEKIFSKHISDKGLISKICKDC